MITRRAPGRGATVAPGGLRDAAVPGLATILAAMYLAKAFDYSAGTAARPGAGVVPVAFGVVFLVGALGTTITALRGGTPHEGEPMLSWIRPLLVFAVIIGYIVLLPSLGQLLAGGLATLVVIRAAGFRSWAGSILCAAAISVSAYYVFVELLEVFLPKLPGS